jgi:hypothetical protein
MLIKLLLKPIKTLAREERRRPRIIICFLPNLSLNIPAGICIIA